MKTIETKTAEIARFEVGKSYRGTIAYGSEKLDCTIEVVKRTAKCIFYPAGGNTSPFRTRIKCDGASEFISDAAGHFVKASDVITEPQLPGDDKPKTNTVADETPAETDGYDETKMTTIETKMTVSELKEALKASRNKVRLHFTAKGNPSWQSVYRYGKKDHEIGYCRISKREANERLAEFGLTANLVIEIYKAKAEAEAAQCCHLCIDQMGAVLAKFAKAENETVNSDETDEVKAEAARKFADKLFRVERFSQKQVDTVVAAILDGQNADTVKKLIDDFKTANFNEAQKVAQRIEEIVAAETVAEAGAEELLAGTIEVDGGAKAFELAAKYFPDGLKFKGAHRWVNGAYEYTFTDGNDKFLHATCDRDNTRVECLEVVDTNESGSKRKPLFIIINPPEISEVDAAETVTDEVIPTPEEKVEKLFDAYEAQNSVAHISENGYIAAVNFQPQNDVRWHCKIRRYQNLDEAIDAVRYVNEHDTFTVTRGGRVETEYGKRNERTREYFARNLYGVEYFKEAYFDELVDQYAVTVDAFNFAVDCEIEEAEIAAAESRAIARILANDNLAARYEKAKSQVKCGRYENGYFGWYFKGKHADDWEHDETKAAACLTRYGLSRFEFSVLSEDETAVINSNGYDESAFDLLPTVDELNDCRSDIEKEFDEFAAEDTDRDARFNHGERHAAKLEKKLHELDPTVEVTYGIADDEDTFYLSFGKYVYRTPFATLDAVEDTFRLWSEDDQVTYGIDKAVAESISNYGATLEVNGETLTFEDGQLSEVASTRYGAYFKVRNGRKNFYYRGNRVSKQDFFGHIETEDRAAHERAAIAKFVDSHGGSEIKPGTNPQANFVAQIHPTLANGRQDGYEVTFDTKDAAHNFITEFKALAGDMKFIAKIKRGSFYGEVIYRHGFNGKEFFAPVTDEHDEDGFTGEDFLNELTVTLDINVAAEKILATADNFRFLDQRHEISLKPDSEIMWERDFRGYKGNSSFLITEVYNHPDGTLREVYLRGNELSTLPVITVKIAESNRNMKLAAKIVDGLNGTLEFLGGGFTKNGKPTVCFDVTNGSEISPMIRVTEAFTDETKSNLDYVEVKRDYAETKTEKRTRYYFATGNVDIDALTDLNGRCNDILKRRHNLNANMRLLTNDEYAGKLAELDSEIRYVEVQIAAVKAGDTFDYVDAAEHIKGVCEDIKTCIDLWTHEHGLTVEQCEQIYVAAHIDRNFDTAVDCKLVDAMISYFKQANKLTAKLRDVTETASYKDVTCQDGATILAHFKGAKVNVDGGGCDILTAWDRLLGHYDTPAQVTAVINRIKACIDGNVGSFTFPTVEELKDKPAYDEKHWAVDFDIYHADSDLTDAELQTYTGLLRTAMTANGNRACVELEDSVITVYGDADGDNDTVDKIVDEMTDSGCWGEYPEDNEDSTPDESTPETKESLREEKYALWDERRAIDGEIIGVKNAISELKDGMRWLRDAGNYNAQIDELDYIIVKLEYRLGILSDKRNAISAKIDDCNEKARLC